jgi:D-lactate dehydrogenase
MRITELTNIVDPARVLMGSLECIAYSSDASFYRLIPQAVVQPNSITEIQTLFRFSQETHIPITFRAAGTSLSGQAITDGILVDLSKHWRGIQIETDGALIRLQPGVIGAQANMALRSFSRRIGPDPASIDSCMIGGILANNASGMCCGVVENAYHTLHSLTVVLPNGLVLDTAATDASERLNTAAPDLARGLLDLKHRLGADPVLLERVRARYQRKNTNGYALNALVDFTEPVDILSHLMIGSEGTLGFIAEAVLHTLPDYPLKYTALLYFDTVQEAAAAIEPLKISGARALEIMDRAALRSVEDLPDAPPELAGLPERAAGLLVEYQASAEREMIFFRQQAAQVCAMLGCLSEPTFCEDPTHQAVLWKLRKGLFPSIGAARRQGTTVIIEDVAFPIPQLANAVSDLQKLFADHGYTEAIIFGHAKDGNLHFVITPSFNTDEEVNRYAHFADDLVQMVSGKYDGALKAEHGTGRNMAPFVETEWGTTAYKIMQDVKALFDPTGLLNPGVIINPDLQAHLHDLKDLPIVENEVDRCIECGFCEPKCPSRRLSLTPRQRIVVRREMARQRALTGEPALLEVLEEGYVYAGLDTCAVDGLCATACPVNINTGDLVKLLRTEHISRRGQLIALSLSQNFRQVERAVGMAVRLGHAGEKVIGVKGIQRVTHLAERISGLNLPKWNAGVPYASRRIPRNQNQNAEFVYFPSCLSRAMGIPPGDPKAASLIDTFLLVSERAGIKVSIPEHARGHCCGMPFGSKGYSQAYQDMLHRTLTLFWEWTNQGRLPVVIDASSCAYTLRSCSEALSSEDLVHWRKLTILDSIEYAHDFLLPRLNITPLPDTVVLHPNCASRKLNLQDKLLAIAHRCASMAVIPSSLDCCAFAGDRGLLFPELTASATSLEAQEVNARAYDGYYSSNLTCEMGMVVATGKPYRSILYLLEKASRSSS